MRMIKEYLKIKTHLSWNSNERANIITENARNNETLVPLLELKDTINNRHRAN